MCGGVFAQERAPATPRSGPRLTMPLPLSVCVITRDAAAELPECLRSVAFADEVVVIDSGSTDDTVRVAEAHGARVVAHPWLGFGAQKNLAVREARHDWVLCLDADERATPELAASVRGVLAGETARRASAYAFARRNRFLGRWLRHGEGYPDWNTRLFDRRHAAWSEDPVHEHVVTTGEVRRLPGDLLHASAESLERYLAKQNRYTSLQADALHARGVRSSAFRMATSPLARFVRFYVLRLGFLDGAPGLVHILIGCGNSFVKHAKLRELELREQAR